MKEVVELKLAIVILAFCGTLGFAQHAERQPDGFRGPVKTIRFEKTTFRIEGDLTIESAPTLVAIANYSRDGIVRETTYYKSNGSVSQKTTETVRRNGAVEETRSVSGSGELISMVSSENDQFGLPKSLTYYNEDGSVKQKSLFRSDPALRTRTISRIAGDGTPLETSVISFDPVSKKSNQKTAEGDLNRTEVPSADGAGNQRIVTRSYGPDGTLLSVSVVDPGHTRMETISYDAAGNLVRRSLQTLEFDSHKNPYKQVHYRWNDAFQKFEPILANYIRITYFDPTER
jgi:hypothetical protein